MEIMFQSYVIVGASNSCRQEREALLKSHGINKNSALDVTQIAPEKNSIPIEAIRQLKAHIFQKPVELNFKVAIFEKAQTLTSEAQNALLKLFEEPPDHALIILEVDNKKNILPTLLSRAVTVTTRPEATTSTKTLIGKNTRDALASLVDVENPQDWLNEQILASYNLLVQQIAMGQSPHKAKRYLKKCSEAKMAIDANVNAKHVLTNLALSVD